MATNILMPALSPTMTEGTLARWLKKEGEQIKAGDVIAEIETDKATMEVEAVDEGVLGKILVDDGTEGVKVNEPIAVLVEQGEAVPAGGAEAARSRREAGGQAGDAPHGGRSRTGRRQVRRAAAPDSRPRQLPPRQRRAAAPAAKPAAQSGNGHDAAGERIFVSPLARRMAQQAGIDLAGAEGQRPERAHRQGGYRGGAAARRGRAPRPRTGGRLRRPRPPRRCPARRRPRRRDHRAAHAGAEQHDAQGDRAAADRGEADHPASSTSRWTSRSMRC